MVGNFNLRFNNKFAQLPGNFYTKIKPENFAENPYLIHANPASAELIGLTMGDLQHPDFSLYFSGKKLLQGSEPLAMVYSGHQFGQWAGQLGDGRALLLGQVRNTKGELWDIQIKGSGITPYSRFADGRAVLRSCIREYLCSEAMHALGIPTTRSLAIVGTGEMVRREGLETGAIFTRLARSHIRFGHFEHFYYNKRLDDVKLLADHVIQEYFGGNLSYEQFFAEVVKRTAEMIANWQAAGFCHGVMNTDNMSILGLTIDYGPFGFMEAFDPFYICNHSDIAGRYSYDQQPNIGLWNLRALARALQFLVPYEVSSEILETYGAILKGTYTRLMLNKLALPTYKEGDERLCLILLSIMEQQRSDYTLTFRYLADSFINPDKWLALFSCAREAKVWLNDYHVRVKAEDINADAMKQRLNSVNPKYVLRNWVAEKAIRAAVDDRDYSVIDTLLNILHAPFEEHEQQNSYANPAPDVYKGLVVSCSS